MVTHLLTVEGMTCGHCVQRVMDALRKVAGVRAAEVSLESRTARVEHADETGVGALLAAVRGAGFEVSGFQRA